MHAPHIRLRRTRILSAALILLLVLAFLPLASPQGADAISTTWWVDDSGVDSPGRGTELAPFKSITYAMVAAASGDTIKVMPGTYDTSAETFPINLRPGVRLTSTDGAESTKIDAEGTGNVFYVLNPTHGAEIAGFEITGGAGNNFGGGIQIDVSANAMDKGWPYVHDNDIHDNTAVVSGGGIYMFGNTAGLVAEPLIENNTIANNTAPSGAGGIFGEGYAAPTIIGNHISGNTTTNFGGGGIGLYQNTDAIVRDNHLSGNDGENAGGIYAFASSGFSLTMSGNYLYSNESARTGGGLTLDGNGTGGILSMNGDRFFANSSADDGGGIDLIADSSTSDIKNVIVSFNNAADEGSGVRVSGTAGLTLTNSTIYGNERIPSGNTGVDAFAGLFAGGTVDPVVVNCVFWDNESWEDITNSTVAYTLVEDDDLTDNGNTLGDGMLRSSPMFIDVVKYDFRLQVGSPCIDSGDSLAAPAKDYEGNARPQDGDGDGTPKPDMGAWERPDLYVGRHAGANRYDTAVKVASAWFDSADTALVASGQNFPDALSAAGLAGSYDAPLFLTPTASIPQAVLDEMSALGVSDAIIIGGKGAVSEDVADTLRAEGYTVDRIAGIDRYATAAAVAEAIADKAGADFSGSVFLARGDTFPDALAVSPLSYTASSYLGVGIPILLTRPSALPPATISAINTLVIEDGVVIGGTGAVSGPTKSTFDAMLVGNGGSASDRWAGSTRYETAKVVAEEGATRTLATWDYIGIATGTNFPDALAGGVAAGTQRGVVLLTSPTSLSGPTETVLRDHSHVTSYVEIFGGTGAVSADVRDDVVWALDW